MTDDMVWEALRAGQNEAKCWRVMSWPHCGAIAIRDRTTEPPQPCVAVDLAQEQAEYERIDFKDEAQARSYIEWRSIKAALEAVVS